jgi:leucine dehydrogenase
MKSIFETMERYGHEQLIFCQNREVGLKAAIAIHDTTLGPALGGTRMWPYQTEEDAILDVLRLSRGMTYKAAAAGLNMGGGKAVIIADPNKDKSEALFRAFGRFVASLHGRFITGEDVGVDVNDVEYMYMETRYVVGLSRSLGGGGDPAPITAFGILHGIRACVREALGQTSLEGLTVALQGLGHVGYHLARLLIDQGMKIVAADVDEEKARRAANELNLEIVEPEAIYEVDADIFAPCALGSVINDRTIPKLKCRIVAGAANNQLQQKVHGDELSRRGILYAPDFVINAGGMINVFVEAEGYDRDRAVRMTRGIYYNLRKIFEIARDSEISTAEAADRLAEDRIRMVRQLKDMYTGQRPHHPRFDREGGD